MAAGVSRKAQLRIALCLGVLAGLAAVIVWVHRVELVLRPWLWSQVRGLQERRASFPDDPAFKEPAGKHGLSRFDVLLSRLIRLHQPGFCGGTNFELMPLRSEEGNLVYLACYEPREVPFDQKRKEPEIDWIVFAGDGCYQYAFLALDASGRALGEARGLRVSQGTFSLVEEPEGFTTLRVPARRTCFSCSSRGVSDLEVLSVDRKGIVPRGRVAGEGLAAPLCRDHRYGSSKLDAAALAGFLISAAPGDLNRALTMIEFAGPNESGRAVPFLGHPDPWLRARAAAIAGANPAFRSKLMDLLEDPDPRVRFAAVEATGRSGGQRCWEDALLPLTEGNHQAVAMRAHRDLVHSTDRAIAARSVLELLRDRDPYVTDADFCGVVGPEAAELAVDWLEAEPDPIWPYLDALELNLWYAFPAEVLRPFAERLVRLFAEGRAEEGSLHRLARVLVKLEHPHADAALMEVLSGAPSSDQAAGDVILQALLTRGAQPPASGMLGVLEEVLRSGGSWPGPYWELARWIENTWDEAGYDCTDRAATSGLNSREEEERPN